MLKKLALVFAMLAMASLAGANTFSSDGTVFEPTHGYTFGHTDRAVLDGSFEAGCDVTWFCATDNTCTWITDLVPLGLWNHDGAMVAWLGGFCGGFATCWTEICQDGVLVDAHTLEFYWMAYVNDQVGYNYISFDGNEVWSKVLDLGDHLLDYQVETVDLSPYSGSVGTLCFGVDNNANCSLNLGDNLFVDSVSLIGVTPTEETNLSTVKALY